MSSSLPNPYTNGDIIIEYRNWKATNLFISQESVKCICSDFENGIVATGDHNGSICLYRTKNKHKEVSAVVGSLVYAPETMGELDIVKGHSSAITQIKFSTTKELYSLGQDGKMVYWQIKEANSKLSLVPLNVFTLDVQSIFQLEEKEDRILAAENNNLVKFSRYINPTTTKSKATSPNSLGYISCFFKTKNDLIISGFSDGEVR